MEILSSLVASVHNVPHPVTGGVRTQSAHLGGEGGEGSFTKAPGLKFFSGEDKSDKKIDQGSIFFG